MFDAMMKLTEQRLERDGAIRRTEFDVPAPSGAGYTDELRASVREFVLSATPQRHQFTTRSGMKGIVYFDRRGRAVEAVLSEIDDDTLAWIAGSLNPRPEPTGSTNYPAPVQEEVSVTAKSRTAMEKFVFSKTPPDSKKKDGGKMVIMFTGDVARAAGQKDYARVSLDKLSDAQLAAVARRLGYATEDIEIIEATGPKTFKSGTFLNLRTQTMDAWFFPLDDQKNGGLSGLQVDIGDNGRPTKAVKKSIPGGHRSSWKERTPDDSVRKKFEAHPDFPSTTEDLDEAAAGPMRSPTDEEVAEMRSFVKSVIKGKVSMAANKTAKGTSLRITLPPDTKAGGAEFVKVAQWLVDHDWVQWPGGDQDYLRNQQKAAKEHDAFYAIGNLMKRGSVGEGYFQVRAESARVVEGKSYEDMTSAERYAAGFPVRLADLRKEGWTSEVDGMSQDDLRRSIDRFFTERSAGPVRTSRDAMDPAIAIYSVSKKDMDEDAFKSWLKGKGIRAKVEKTSDGYRAVAESTAD